VIFKPSRKNKDFSFLPDPIWLADSRLQVQIIQCTKKLAIQFKLDCTHPPEFFAFFLREKSWHSNQTNGILSSIDRKSLRDSNK
jgi:hypothetical protein